MRWGGPPLPRIQGVSQGGRKRTSLTAMATTSCGKEGRFPGCGGGRERIGPAPNLRRRKVISVDVRLQVEEKPSHSKEATGSCAKPQAAAQRLGRATRAKSSATNTSG